MNIRNFNFNTTEVTAIASDTNNGDKIWIAFAKNSNDVCWVKKVSANDLTQVYFEFSLTVDAITDILWFDEDYLYITVDDDTNLFYMTNPQAPTYPGPEAVLIPSGINEAPISIKDDGTYIYLLFPGSAIGEDAKICKYNDTSFVETIDLTGINDAIGMTIDGTDIWVVTNESPSKLIRVYQISGDIYTFAITTLE